MVVAGGLPDEAEIAAAFDSFVKNESERFARAYVMFGRVFLAVVNKSNETIRFDGGAKRLEIRKNQGYVMKGRQMFLM
eukprot:2750558-Lingulodinium_polyedra.AAC.1